MHRSLWAERWKFNSSHLRNMEGVRSPGKDLEMFLKQYFLLKGISYLRPGQPDLLGAAHAQGRGLELDGL